MARTAEGQASAEPCTNAAAACTEWIAVKTHPQRLLVYRSYPLDRRNDRIVRALVIVHGGMRLAADQFTNELAAAFLSGALPDTLLVAPRFASNTTAACADALAARRTISSAKSNDVTLRYAMASRIHDTFGIDNWQYGLRNRAGYTSSLTDAQLRQQFASRSVAYLLGGADIVPFGGFDDSCPATAQGPTRLARGLAYCRYVNELHGARHQAVVVDACGHDDRCMFTSKQALPLLFPSP